MRILTAAELREVDRLAAQSLSLPTALLMENAGREVARAAGRIVSEEGCVYVLTGKGNNGGDGWCAARHLLVAGVSVCVWPLADESRLSGDALLNAKAARACGVPLVSSLESAGEGDVVVDALFGTGLTRALEGDSLRFLESIREARERGARVVSVDLPSGLDADRCTPVGPHVVADLTLTLHALKPALVQHPSRGFCGEIQLASIGAPLSIGSAPRRRWLNEAPRALLPRRCLDAHKGSSGHLLVVAGSKGKSGAAMLVCRAAMRAGAGLVTLAAPAEVIDRVLGHMPEVMGLEMPEITSEALVDALNSRTALAIGPGIEWSEGTGLEIATALQEIERPALLDADALNALADSKEAQALLTKARIPPLLTPHPGEMARLLGVSTTEVQSDRLKAASEAARRFNAPVFLKGACPVLAHPDGTLEVFGIENPALATAGSGDVLTGIGGALLARGLTSNETGLLAPWVHALAAKRGPAAGLVASDLIECLPQVLSEFK